MKIEDGSVWWTIEPSWESANYDDGGFTRCRPTRVKAHRRSVDDDWDLSSFAFASTSTSSVSSSSRIGCDADIGRTLFATEREAWVAYLGDVPTPGTIADELDNRAADLRPLVCSFVAEEVLAPHVASLHEIASSLRAMEIDLGRGLTLRTETESLLHVDAYPDEDYPIRILQAHLDSQTSSRMEGHSDDGSAEILAEVMNKAAAKRAKILRLAISLLMRGKR